MRKNVLTLSIILCLLSVSLLKNYKISVKAGPNVIYVPDDYEKIQWAIGNATDGDTIFVKNGTYHENVVINKSIALIGENYEFTIIDGNGSDDVISIETNNVTIRGFTLNNSGYQSCGVFLKPLFINNVIESNVILNSYYGISIFSSNYNVIESNVILNSYYGISISSSSSNIISNNIISNNSFGINLHFSRGNLISENTANNNVYFGIYLFSSTDNLVSCNILSYNKMAGAVLYSDSTDNVFYGNNILNNLYYGLSLYSSPNNKFYGNNIIDNGDYGIYFRLSGDNIFYHNNFNNTKQVWSDSTNIWSWDYEGNYWSDYTGRDLNEDGIGDTPYIKNNMVHDTNPLVGMFYDFIISLGKKTYHVNVISNSTISNFRFDVIVETCNKRIYFNATHEEGTFGFCRIAIPTALMNYSYIIFIDQEEITPTLLGISNNTFVYLYFTYPHENQAIVIVSSEILRLYKELLESSSQLQTELYNLLSIYNAVLYNYTLLWGNYTLLQKSFEQLNASYQYLYDLNVTFHNFLNDYGKLQEDFDNLSLTYQSLLDAFVLLLGNFTQLQEDYQLLNSSYQDHLRSYSENVSNVQNLTYVLAAVTAILIIVTTYLSKRAHGGGTLKIKRFEEE